MSAVAPDPEVLRRCAPRPTQQRNNPGADATPSATPHATVSLRTLARAVIERNTPSNIARNTVEIDATDRATTVAAHPSADDLAECAAIVEEGAKVPREWAEGFARLSLAPCPRGVAFSEWRAMIDAAGRFLDAWGGAAAALGWSAGDLFSLDPAAPLARRDRRGAAFFMAGAEVVAVTAEAITLRRPCGSTRPRGETLHRLLRGAGSLDPPAWETGPWARPEDQP